MYEFQSVSTELQNRARILDNGESCWNRAEIEAVLEEIATAGRFILGFDMCTFPGGRATPRLHGGSAYDMTGYENLPWSERVALGLNLAVADLARTKELSGIPPPHDDVWYIVTSIGEGETYQPGVIEI